MTGEGRGASSTRRHGERSAARLAAVQALYQVDISGIGADDVTDEFLHHRLGDTGEDGTVPALDAGLFAEVVRGACARRDEIDPMIEQALGGGWTLDRLELLLRAVLRAGAFELLARADVPAPVVMDEYIEVARAFFGRGEPGLVNGVLDRLAHELRPAEFAAGDGAS
ncbi:MAG: transcription antitermination factor NusB [Alphaproteobacteria bacterium]